MKEQRIQAYINLIKQVCGLFAQQYIDAGRENEAEFREAFPQQWATVQNNLGNAYLYRISG